MTYRIALCDNEPEAIVSLEYAVRRWAGSRAHVATLGRFASAEAFLFAYDEDKAWDILLLDIEMGTVSGVDLARAIRAENKEVQIVFVTGYMEYIADGYEVDALHYLLKPVTVEKLMDVLDRAAQKLKKNERALLLRPESGTVRVPLYEIRYLEVQRNYVTVHADRAYTVKATLSELEKGLDAGFFKTCRSCIVSLKYIHRVTRDEIHLVDGTVLPLSRGQYDAINRAMIDYL